MSYKDKYIKRSNSNASTQRLRYIDSTKDTINRLFMGNPSVKEVTFNDEMESRWVWIVEDTKVPSVKKIIMKPNDTIEAGCIVNWNNEKWLCLSADKSKGIYETGFIEKCNNDLKWVDNEGIIRSYPCVFYYGTKANFGTYSDKVMTLPDGRRQVVVQKNEHTKKIKRDTRFIFGESVFKVIDFDYVSDEGLVNVNLKDDQYDPVKDNLELGIADYYGRFNEEEQPEDNPLNEGLSIVIKSNATKPDEIKRNQQKEYYVEVYNGTELISNETVSWQLFADDQTSPTSLGMITSQTGTKCTVKNNDAVGSFIQLKATLLSDNSVVAWMRIQLVSLF